MNNYNMTIEFKPYNKQDPYLQWEHIAIWHFLFTIELLIREQMGREYNCKDTID